MENHLLSSNDILINERTFLRLDVSMSGYEKKLAEKYVKKAIAAHEADFKKFTDKFDRVCFSLKSLNFADAHFQEEGVYCATKGWLAKYYNVEIAPTNVEFEKSTNRHIFDIP